LRLDNKNLRSLQWSRGQVKGSYVCLCAYCIFKRCTWIQKESYGKCGHFFFNSL